jgi:L-aspartate oxidase
MNKVVADDVIIIGSGLAGLVCALQLAPRPVTLVTKTPGLAGGSSILAKGGIAVAIGPGDTPGHHAADTLSAGAGLSNPQGALQLAEDSLENLQFLQNAGVRFDSLPGGTLQLAQEAAHRYPRVVHAGGDATGRIVMKSLVARVRATACIHVLENTQVHDLVVHDNHVRGIVAFAAGQQWTYYQSSQVVVATGGIGMCWWHTTNPQEATGDGLAMAARAGAKLSDLEFVQFHPTAAALNGEKKGVSMPLLTEALRGAGACLVDDWGRRFMLQEHPAAEMAPRDVVARAIERRIANGQSVFLDMRSVIRGGNKKLFPQAIAAARLAGFDPAKDPVPVTPAAHYHMGGIQTDASGKTSIHGLYACGEVATTGIHGANRLASNSLLEALVYARRVAVDIAGSPIRHHDVLAPIPAAPKILPDTALTQLDCMVDALRKLMSRNVGVLRSGKGLAAALSQLGAMHKQMQLLRNQEKFSQTPSENTVTRWGEARNILLVARLVTLAAQQRNESRGAHYRKDYPCSAPEWKRRQTVTVDQLAAVSERRRSSQRSIQSGTKAH